MQVDQSSEMKTYMESQENGAGTSNVPAANEKPADDQLPEVMIEMRIGDERNANREEKVICFVKILHHDLHSPLLTSPLACAGYGDNYCKRQWDRNGTSYYNDSRG